MSPLTNNDCKVHKDYSGCVTFKMPDNGYVRFRIVVTDSLGLTASSFAQPLNNPNMRFFAGNTDVGVGQSAKSAVFNAKNGRAMDSETGLFVINSKGEVYSLLRSILVL